MEIPCFQASQEPGGGKRGSHHGGKTKTLNEYLALAGGNRKYAIFKLGREGKQQLRLSCGSYVNVRVSSGKRRNRVYTRYYDDEVKKVLVKLWAFFRRVCGERLTPLVKANLKALCLRKRFGITGELREKLNRISRSTVERPHREERRKNRLKGRSTARKGTLLKNQIPVRVFWAWDDRKAAFPVPLYGLDSDGGGEFINWHFKDWRERRGITFTRGRSRHSNGNCFAEQKNSYNCCASSNPSSARPPAAPASRGRRSAPR